MTQREPSLSSRDVTSAPKMEEILMSPGMSVKLKKYMFTRDARLHLLKAVREFDAHLAGHGETDKSFEKVHSRFISEVPTKLLLTHQEPRVKTLRDKLRTILTARKTKNRANESASGIAEEVSEEDQLLDDFLSKIEDNRLRRKVESDKLTRADKKLVEARQKIQRRALSRLPTKSASPPPSEKRKKDDYVEWSIGCLR